MLTISSLTHNQKASLVWGVGDGTHSQPPLVSLWMTAIQCCRWHVSRPPFPSRFRTNGPRLGPTCTYSSIWNRLICSCLVIRMTLVQCPSHAVHRKQLLPVAPSWWHDCCTVKYCGAVSLQSPQQVGILGPDHLSFGISLHLSVWSFL